MAERKPGDQDDGLGETARQMRAAQPWMDAVWKLVGGSVVGVVGGVLLDRYVHTAPWGVIGLSVLGIGVGFYGFLREAMKLGKR